MDACVIVPCGSEEIRDIQHWLNESHLDRSTVFVIPCDGHYSRDV